MISYSHTSKHVRFDIFFCHFNKKTARNGVYNQHSSHSLSPSLFHLPFTTSENLYIPVLFCLPVQNSDVGIFLIDAFNSFYRHIWVYAFLIWSLIHVRLKYLRLRILKIEIQEVKVNVIGIVCVSVIDMNAPMMEKIEFIFQPLELAFFRICGK